MKHYTFESMDWFHCIGGECPYNCCTGWRISIDQDTDAFYQSVEGEFGEELNREIDRSGEEAFFKLRSNRRCPFLNEDNLCRIFQNLGQDKLCQTCTTYPRTHRPLNEYYTIHYLTMSCPEVVREYLSRKPSLKLRVTDDGKLPGGGKPDPFVLLCGDAMEAGDQLLKDRSCSIDHRQRLFLMMNASLKEAADRKDWDQAAAVLTFFRSPQHYRSVAASSPPRANLASKVHLIREFSDLIFQKYPSPELSTLLLGSIRYIRGERTEEELGQVLANLRTVDSGEMEREQEHLLRFALFRHYLADTIALHDGDLFHRAVFTVLFDQLYRIFVAFLSAEQGSLHSFQQRTLVASYLCRYFDHTIQNFPRDLDHMLDQRGIAKLDFLFQIIA